MRHGTQRAGGTEGWGHSEGPPAKSQERGDSRAGRPGTGRGGLPGEGFVSFGFKGRPAGLAQAWAMPTRLGTVAGLIVEALPPPRYCSEDKEKVTLQGDQTAWRGTASPHSSPFRQPCARDTLPFLPCSLHRPAHCGFVPPP